MRERDIRCVPRPVLVLLALGLAVQIGWHAWRPGPAARAQDLPAPPSEAGLRVMAAGDSVVFSKLLMLWLQAFDSQPGISVPFSRLDFDRVEDWLGRILALDPRSQYPLLAATRVYAAVPDPQKKRQMLAFVYDRFIEDPNVRWPWLAHAAIVARHQLEDPALALEYARAITHRATDPRVPAWARDMSVLLHEQLGEVEAARLLIAGLLESGRVTDPRELQFLVRRLEELAGRDEAPGDD